MLSVEKSMAIERGNLLLAPAPPSSGQIYTTVAGTGTKNRFLARLSGRRRHVRRTAPGVGVGGGGGGEGTPGYCYNLGDEACCSSLQKLSVEDDDEQPQPQPQPEPEPSHPTTPQYRNTVPASSTITTTTTPDAADAVAVAAAVAAEAEAEAETETYGKNYDTATTNDHDQSSRRRRIPPYVATILIITYYTLFGMADACSSRSTPKPRPPTSTPRPNITFHMYTCPPDYAEWYCLNGATCFTVKIAESLLYNCLCANGYIGQRCEFKDLDGSYLPSRQRVMLETASIAGGATIAVFLVVIICIAAYIHCKRKQKELRTSSNGVDAVDGPGRDPELRPFSNNGRSLRIFMAKNANNNPNTAPSIEQTKMPGWDYSSAETTRMASISEGRRSNNQ